MQSLFLWILPVGIFYTATDKISISMGVMSLMNIPAGVFCIEMDSTDLILLMLHIDIKRHLNSFFMYFTSNYSQITVTDFFFWLS